MAENLTDDDALRRGLVGPAFAAMLPAHVRLLLLTDGKRISQVVQVVAELGIADLLAEGPLTADELAKLADCNADALGRVLRVAACFGVFAEDETGRFAMTELAEPLRSDTVDSKRDLVLFNGHDMVRLSYGELMHTVRTGRPAFEKVYGRGFFEHLRTDADAARLFDAAMMQMSHAGGALLLDQYDFGAFTDVADIGGGNGTFLAAVASAHPHLYGTLVDLPDVVAGVAQELARMGLADRIDVKAADFFEELPRGHDAYIVKSVLHDWDDAAAVRILRRVHDAMSGDPEARLLVCEFLVGEGNHWDRGKLLDLDMLLRFGGRERTLRQWRVLLAEAGFELVNDPVAGRWAVLECRAVRCSRPSKGEI